MKGTAYLFQAALIILWWVMISVNDHVYSVFSYTIINKQSYFALLVPDVLLLGILSLIRAYFKKEVLGYIILGAFSYATLFCINASFLGHDGLIPTTIMTFGLFFNLYLCFPKYFHRQSDSNSLLYNSIKTTIQILSFWLLFLVLIPYIILLNTQPLISLPSSTPLLIVSTALFLLFSLLGLLSAFEMVKKGNGTPLPVDSTNLLVISGPYSLVRNPMAVAGVGQLVSISLAFSSVPILLFAILGALSWHIIVRPIEEQDLYQKFGEDYLHYKRTVKCWIPTSLFEKYN
ncbi:MAG TPA: hypothetical protein DEQ34_13015 [Balneolaceae bacterium]|nr:hypothetical protein [Balneolaceae bacterium]|tara:strand:+ start:26045 stop:26911 length:867 start_codon:yes stop_codon:yes gene_type:complete